MLKCPNCCSGLSFWELNTARAGMVTCANCTSRLQVSGVALALLFWLTFGSLGPLLTLWIPNLFIMVVASILILALSYYIFALIFYSVEPLSNKAISKE